MCKVVAKDWLEDLMHRRRRLPEKEYSLDQTLRRERAKKKKQEHITKGIEKGEKAVNPSEHLLLFPSSLGEKEGWLTAVEISTISTATAHSSDMKSPSRGATNRTAR